MYVKRWWIGVVIAALGGGVAALWWAQQPEKISPYQTQTLQIGNLTQIVTANGTLNPVVLVKVGTQISGTVKRLVVDYNDSVRAGQLLAELDPALLQAQIAQSQANLATAQANLRLAQQQWQRTQALVAQHFLSPAERDNALQKLATAQAAQQQAQAQLQKDRTNLAYSQIRSPIDGVVIGRDIDVGQTVAASFQTPTLFQIAKNLADMQIDTTVAEADIGKIRPKMAVRFSVDAFGDRQFNGTVRQIRLNPTVQQNVVTYNVVVSVDNRDGQLLPGMTANVQLLTAEKQRVLRIPNAALRFTPKVMQDSKDSTPAGQNRMRVKRDTAWCLVNGQLQAVKLKLGISDNQFTEVLAGLQAGDKVVVRESIANEKEGKFRLKF